MQLSHNAVTLEQNPLLTWWAIMWSTRALSPWKSQSTWGGEAGREVESMEGVQSDHWWHLRRVKGQRHGERWEEPENGAWGLMGQSEKAQGMWITGLPLKSCTSRLCKPTTKMLGGRQKREKDHGERGSRGEVRQRVVLQGEVKQKRE